MIHFRASVNVTKALIKHGRAIDLVTISDTGDPWNPVQTETVQPVLGLQTSFTAQEIDGDLIRATDKRFLIDSGVEPNTAMRLKDGDSDYSIINVETLQPGDLAILYKLQARL